MGETGGLNYEDYRDCLRTTVQSQGRRGFKSKLAAAAGCQLSHLSQVLSGHVNLTEDQAFGIASHLSFDPVESEYFLLMVRAARAGAKGYREHLLKKARLLRTEHKQLHRRLQTRDITHQHKETYYSAWYYSAHARGPFSPGTSKHERLAKNPGA